MASSSSDTGGTRRSAGAGRNDLALPLGADELVIRNRYEALSITNDAIIGVLFVAGSILFLWPSTSTIAAWLFIVGSVQFLLRPVIRLARRTHLKRFDSVQDRTDHAGDF
ncbi:YrhK family protein [Microbacterium sp. LRZ72]|uniref:YrhK family protein n=1 Tax=Microbacterium sp. LRZ72 TaxID=2942481 RepID=UPI0029AA543F|nr:YrhK family protein [Microbacterium sp. LRZ72]MDX2377956.1 YrhK family protein [Microbacterium sp. LRZ72]